MTGPTHPQQCDHCEGEGVIWEPCHVGYAHEYDCDCNHEIQCGNCEGVGTIPLTGKEQSSCSE